MEQEDKIKTKENIWCLYILVFKSLELINSKKSISNIQKSKAEKVNRHIISSNKSNIIRKNKFINKK